MMIINKQHFLQLIENMFLIYNYSLVILQTAMHSQKQYDLSLSSKKDRESIALFEYAVFSFFRSHSTPTNYSSQHKHRGLAYNYIAHQILSTQDINAFDIQSSIPKLYASNNSQKIAKDLYLRTETVKMRFVPFQKNVVETIDFVLIQPKIIRKQEKMKHSQSLKLIKPDFEENSCGSQGLKSKDYELYVLHYNSGNEESLKWEHLIEKYHFTYVQSNDSTLPLIKYQALLTTTSHWLSLNNIYLEEYFLSRFCLKNQQGQLLNLIKLKGSLKILKDEQRMQISQQNKKISFQNAHRRELLVPPEHYDTLKSLKKLTLKEFISLNTDREVNEPFLENLACRFLKWNDYKLEGAEESIRFYLEWERNMRKKYQLKDFRKFIDMDIFTYLGKDSMGRPVILNKARNVKCSQIRPEEQELFVDFNLYFLEIHLQDLMDGYVDQFCVLGDTSNQTSENTNLSATKSMISQFIRLSPYRHYRILIFDVNIIGRTFYSVVKPLLPSSFVQILQLMGSDRAQLYSSMLEFLPTQIIPQFLGGGNPLGKDKPISDYTPIEMLTTDVTNEKTFHLTPKRRL